MYLDQCSYKIMCFFIALALAFTMEPLAPSFAQGAGGNPGQVTGFNSIALGGTSYQPGGYGPAADASFALLLLASSVFIFSCFLLAESYKFTRMMTRKLDKNLNIDTWHYEFFILFCVLVVMIILWFVRRNWLTDSVTRNTLLDIIYEPSAFVHLPLVMSSLVSALALVKFLTAIFIVRVHQGEPEFTVKSAGTPAIGLIMAAITLVGSIVSIIGTALNFW